MSERTRALLAAEAPAQDIPLKCKNSHDMTSGPVPGRWGCDGCSKVGEQGSTAYSCRTCNQDFCGKCAAGIQAVTATTKGDGPSEAEMVALPSVYTRHGVKQVNWTKIKAMLPYDRSPESVEERKKLWGQIDMNGNGYVSLAEVDKGLRDVFQIDEIFNCKPVIIRAFNAAKGIGQGIKPPGWDEIQDRYKTRALDPVDYIERKEFRVLLIYLHEYTALRQLFDKIDADHDHRVSFEEFSLAVPLLRSMGQTIPSPEATFKEIDADGGGMILFREFSDWALKKNLGAHISREGLFE